MEKKKKHNYGEQQHIEALVFRFQSGDEEAGMELLRVYGFESLEEEPTKYIGKFYKMIRYGKLDFKDYDSRLFVGCFLERETEKALHQSYQYRPVKQAAVRKLAEISKSLKVLSDEELKQELCFLLLRQAKRYKKKNRTFGAYLYHSYRYAISNWIKDMLKKDEPYTKIYDNLVNIADDRLKDDDSEVDVQDSIFLVAPMIQVEEELGNSWVRGLTCSEEFKDLTPLQRLIIKLNYYDGWSDGKIAEKLGLHINTIFRQRTKAGKIVQETVARLRKEGY